MTRPPSMYALLQLSPLSSARALRQTSPTTTFKAQGVAHLSRPAIAMPTTRGTTRMNTKSRSGLTAHGNQRW